MNTNAIVFNYFYTWLCTTKVPMTSQNTYMTYIGIVPNIYVKGKATPIGNIGPTLVFTSVGILAN